MTHTPGPWELDDECSVYSAERRIARMDDKGGIDDARLIAAAPDLLAALQSAEEWMSCVEPHLRDGAPFKQDRERIRSAIAKATGGP